MAVRTRGSRPRANALEALIERLVGKSQRGGTATFVCLGRTITAEKRIALTKN